MPTQKDAIELLKADHRKVRELLTRLENTTTEDVDERETLLAQIEREVKIHSQIEEEIFYPAFKEAAEDDEETELFFEAHEEHHVVDMVLPELKEADPGSEVFSAKAKVLKELIEHHADEEEQEMFRIARDRMSAEQIDDLGGEIREMKARLTEEWEEGEEEPAPVPVKRPSRR